MLHIAVCDDISEHLQHSQNMIQDILASKEINCEIYPFHTSEDLLQSIRDKKIRPEIAVLDIELNGESGINLAKKMNQYLPTCQIIFLTNYIDYASDVYEAEHVWFVTKKKADRYLEPALDKAIAVLTESSTHIQGIIVRNQGKSIVVPLNTILYISRVGRKAQIKCMHQEYYDSRRPVDLIPRQLESTFLQCHQGYWVNINMIEELDHNEFVLKGGVRTPISRNFRDSARQRFFEIYHYPGAE